VSSVRKKIGLSKQVHSVPPEPADYRHREHPLPGGRLKSNQTHNQWDCISYSLSKDISHLWRDTAYQTRKIFISSQQSPGTKQTSATDHPASSAPRIRYSTQESPFQFFKPLKETTQSESHPTGFHCLTVQSIAVCRHKAPPGTHLLHRTNQRYHE
jgi:hypothetical protein